jgi:hypothetical protein
MGNASEKKKDKENAETLLYAKIFILVCHVRVPVCGTPGPTLMSSCR